MVFVGQPNLWFKDENRCYFLEHLLCKQFFVETLLEKIHLAGFCEDGKKFWEKVGVFRIFDTTQKTQMKLIKTWPFHRIKVVEETIDGKNWSNRFAETRV